MHATKGENEEGLIFICVHVRLSVTLSHFAAEGIYRQALQADPNHVATLNNLGHLVHTHHNNLTEAEELYRLT